MAEARDAILGALKTGTSELPPVWSAEVEPHDFVTEFEALGGEWKAKADLAELAGKTVFVEDDVPAEIAAGLTKTDDVWSADAGISLAEAAVAETGSFLFRAAPEHRRLASLAPPLHIVLIPKDRIVPTLEDAFALVTDRTSVFVTGPSRTADIEGVLVRGIHGPRRLWAIPLE